MFPSPVQCEGVEGGQVHCTNIGVFALRLPGVVPITRLPDRTRVVTRLSRLVSAWTMTDCARADMHNDVVLAGQIHAGERRK